MYDWCKMVPLFDHDPLVSSHYSDWVFNEPVKERVVFTSWSYMPLHGRSGKAV